MDFKEQLNFELYVNDLLDGIKTGKELTDFAEELHDILENVMQDYADDNDLSDDYEPSY